MGKFYEQVVLKFAIEQKWCHFLCYNNYLLASSCLACNRDILDTTDCLCGMDSAVANNCLLPGFEFPFLSETCP